MKYRLVVHQSAVVREGLGGKVTCQGLLLLDYLRGWADCDKAVRIFQDGKAYTWLDYAHANSELPIVFNPSATPPALKNQLSKLMQQLQRVGLIETIRPGRRLHFHMTPLGWSITGSYHDSRPHNVTCHHEGNVTCERAETVTQTQDDSRPANMNEPGINKTNQRNNTPPETLGGGGAESLSNSAGLISKAELIYDLYPKKFDKREALYAIAKAIAKHGFKFVHDRTRMFAATYDGEFRFIPPPARWFEDERFNVDPATWRQTTAKSSRIVDPGQFGSGVSKL